MRKDQNILDGTYEVPQKVVEDLKKVYPYFRIEPGRDDFVRHGNEFAHPFAAEAMSMDVAAAIEGMRSPDKTKEQMRGERQALIDANKQYWDQIDAEHPEFEKYGYWEEYDVDGCAEEPDAPKVHVVVRRLRESFKKGPYPVVLFIPVSGLYQADPWTAANAPITKYLGCQLIVPWIRVFPDAEYPAAVNDLHAVYQWMIENAEKLEIDADRIVIIGGSSGGHLAAALPFRLKRYNWCGGPMPRGVVTMDSFYDDRETTRSMRTLYKSWDGLANRLTNMRYMGMNFASGFIGPEAYANHATIDECRGLPPYAIYQNQDCPGCDPAIEFMQKLNEAGVFCSFYMGGGTTHVGNPNVRVWQLFCATGDSYEPTVGIDAVARMDAFYVGHITDFLQYDFRRQ